MLLHNDHDTHRVHNIQSAQHTESGNLRRRSVLTSEGLNNVIFGDHIKAYPTILVQGHLVRSHIYVLLKVEVVT